MICLVQICLKQQHSFKKYKIQVKPTTSALGASIANGKMVWALPGWPAAAGLLLIFQ